MSQQKLAISISLVCILLYMSPFLILGQDCHVLIHDNLDITPVARLAAQPEFLFATPDTSIPQLMNGLPRRCLGAENYVSLFLQTMMPPYPAYVSNQVLVRAVAFIGMYLFLGAVMGGYREPLLLAGVALTFSLLPYYPRVGVSVAGIPLLAYSFMKIQGPHGHLGHWICIAAFPAYSNLFVGPIFLLFLLAAAWATLSIRQQRLNIRFLAAIATCFAGYLLTNFYLLDSVFVSDYVSIRSEFVRKSYDLPESWDRTKSSFLHGQYHVASYHLYAILPTTLLFLLVTWLTNRRASQPTVVCPTAPIDPRLDATPDHPKTPDLGRETSGDGQVAVTPLEAVAALLLAAVAVSVWYGLYSWEGLIRAKELLGPLGMIQWDRLHWLHPTIWYLAFAYALVGLAKTLGWGKYLAIALICLQATILFVESDFVRERRSGHPTFSKFFAREQFEQIKSYIERKPEEYRVVSLGMHPSIALYNGLYCLDGYGYDYPLEYMRRFRSVIAPELAKSAVLREYFDDFGIRFYLFADELGRHYLYTKSRNKEIRELKLDIGALKDLGGQFVLSAVRIANPSDSGLDLLRVFDHPESAWRIHLYAISP